jgi:hypothetical protein
MVNETVVNVLRLKFSCSENGYEELLRQKLPLSSARTVQRRLQNLNFDSGILDEVLKFLDTKVQTFAPSKRDCALVLDEMSIMSASVYDISLNKYFGKVTLPDHTGVSSVYACSCKSMLETSSGVLFYWKFCKSCDYYQ